MERQPITDIAENFGLALERPVEPRGPQTIFRVYKGAKRIFTGNEHAVREFFRQYEKDRPALFAENMFGYTE